MSSFTDPTQTPSTDVTATPSTVATEVQSPSYETPLHSNALSYETPPNKGLIKTPDTAETEIVISPTGRSIPNKCGYGIDVNPISKLLHQPGELIPDDGYVYKPSYLIGKLRNCNKRDSSYLDNVSPDDTVTVIGETENIKKLKEKYKQYIFIDNSRIQPPLRIPEEVKQGSQTDSEFSFLIIPDFTKNKLPIESPTKRKLSFEDEESKRPKNGGKKRTTRRNRRKRRKSKRRQRK